jgi:predicted permease
MTGQSMFSRARHLLRNLFRKRDVEQELDDEMRSYVGLLTEEKIAGGVPASAARRAALVEAGGVEQIKEEVRAVRAGALLEQFAQDLRFGLRMLRRNPGISLVVVLCLTVAIGANAAVFSWIEGILLRPFPLVAHQERMMALTGTKGGAAGQVGESTGISWPDFFDLRRNTTMFDWMIVSRITGATLNLGEHAEGLSASIVSSNYFDALGVRPILGRGFRAEEDVGRNAHPVVVIGYQVWKDDFQSDPNIIGKAVLLNGVPHTIIGVTPDGFVGTFTGRVMQLWVPVSMQEVFDPAQPGYKLDDRNARWIESYVRLKPGVSPAQAQQEISAVAKRLEEQFPQTNRDCGVKLYPLWQTPFNAAGVLLPTLAIALVVVVFVLLIVCANVSNLLLVRAFGRRQEMVVRVSMGASRGRVIRQLLTEGLLLCAIAATGGLLLAYWCRNLLVLLLPPNGLNLPGRIDARVLALSVAICIGATLLFALAPALQASKLELASTLKTESASVIGGRRARVRFVLVLVQVALSFVLLAGTGLLIRSLRAIQSVDPGYDTGVLAAWFDLSTAGYDIARAKAFDDALLQRVSRLKEVAAASFGRSLPMSYRAPSFATVAVDGMELEASRLPAVAYNEVGPAYFTTMRIPLVAGREFDAHDNENAMPVAIVNDAMAAKFWPAADPAAALGRRLQVAGKWMQVVGIVKTPKYRWLTEPPRAFFYVPMRQNFPMRSFLLFRTTHAGQTADMTELIGREVHALDSKLSPYSITPLKELVDRSTGQQRAAVTVIALSGGVAILLAAIGLFSVISYGVSQKRREFGMRMALGAAPGKVLRLVLREGLTVAAAGVVLGCAAALAMTRLLGYLLFRVGPRDPVAFSAALVMIALASLAASFIPAWRAARMDPLEALRS